MLRMQQRSERPEAGMGSLPNLLLLLGVVEAADDRAENDGEAGKAGTADH